MSTMRIAVAGASGRMGRMLIEAVVAAPDAQLVGAFDRADSPSIGDDAGAFFGHASGVRVTADVAQALADATHLIDFTRPQGTLAHLEIAAEREIRTVIGTTGFSAEELARIQAIAGRCAIMMAPNMSVGVNATLKILELAARILGADHDIEVIEAHHRHKVDAPSGTALKMGEVIARTLGRDLNEVGVFERHGDTGERAPGSIGFSAIRGGDIVGDHTVLFAGNGERIEITHRSASRGTYAQGSLRACRFLTDKSAGLYDMFDVLGLR